VTATVYGKVTWAGIPLQGMLVRMYYVDPKTGYGTYKDSTTDSNGKYKISFEDDEFKDVYGGIHSFPGPVVANPNQGDLWFTTSEVTLDPPLWPGDNIQKDFSLTAVAGGVEGYVKNTSGNAIANADVNVSEGASSYWTKTDSNGYYKTPRYGDKSAWVKPTVSVIATGYEQQSKTVELTKGKYNSVNFNLSPKKYSLRIDTANSAQGTTDPSPGLYEYDYGTKVKCTALPNSGYKFKRWLVDTTYYSTDNPITLTMDQSHGLLAYFESTAPPPPPPAPKHKLTISVGEGNGTTSPAPGTYEYDEGSTVSVTAYPDSGYSLYYWTLDGAWQQGVNPINVTMDKDHTLVAYFKYTGAPPEVGAVAGKVLDAVTGSGIADASVVIDGKSAITDIGGNYVINDVPVGTRTLTASKSGYSTASKSVTIEKGKTASVDISLEPTVLKHKLTIVATSGGTTNPAPGTYEYDHGATATVSAVPSSGYEFDHWALDSETHMDNPISVTVDKDYSLVAYFRSATAPKYTLNISSTGGGTTQPAPGAYQYGASSAVTVTAVPNSGYAFDHWTLDGSSSAANPITVTMDRDHTLVAYFRSVTAAPPVPSWLPYAVTGVFMAVAVVLGVVVARRLGKK
jgi:hypothetical protein